MMKPIVSLILLLSTSVSADEPPKGDAAKPTIKVLEDGFPSGHDTPEGAAADMARAFIKRDYALFESTCVKPFGGGESRKEYEKFLEGVKAGMKAEAEKKVPSPGGPKEISKIYAARFLSLNGPASAGYALFDIQEIMFVDVVATLHNGKQTLIRTMVIKTPKGRWVTHPAPHIDSILSTGLNEEKPSVKSFSEAYKVEKP